MNDEEVWSRLNLPDPGLAELAAAIVCSDLDTHLRDMAIEHPSISDAELLTFMERLTPGIVRRILWATKRVPVLSHWMLNGDMEDRRTVAFNPNGDAYIGLLALSDSEPAVRCNIMFSPAISDEQVRWHRDNDPDSSVRDAAEVALETDMGQYLRAGGQYVKENDDGTFECNLEWLEEE